MSDGRWIRWGRGSCEGYGIGLGTVRDLTGHVVRNVGTPETWRASIGGIEKVFESREAAFAHVEHEIDAAMGPVLSAWRVYCALREKHQHRPKK